MPIMVKGKVTEEWRRNCLKSIECMIDVIATLEEMDTPKDITTDLRRCLVEFLGGTLDERTHRLLDNVIAGKSTVSFFILKCE